LRGVIAGDQKIDETGRAEGREHFARISRELANGRFDADFPDGCCAHVDFALCDQGSCLQRPWQ